MKRFLSLLLVSTLLACGAVSKPEVTAWFEVSVDPRQQVTLFLRGEARIDEGKLVELEVRLLEDNGEDTPVQAWADPIDDLGSDVQALGKVYTHTLTRCGRYRAVVIVRDDAGGEGTSEPYSFSVSCDSWPSACTPDARYAYAPTADAAPATKGSCTVGELDALGAEMDREEASYPSLRAAVAGTCAECIFTDLPAATLNVPTWAAFGVVVEGPERGYGQRNEGWCLANKLGSPACGALVHARTQCEARVCEHCSTITGHEECTRSTYLACGYLQRAAQAECPTGWADAAGECNAMSPMEQIRDLCGP